MAKLKFIQDFTLEVKDEKYTGILQDLTKSQKATFDKLNKVKKDENKLLQTKLKKIKKLERKILINEKQEKWSVLESLEDQLTIIEDEVEVLTLKLSDPKPIEVMFKKRIQTSVVSDDLDAILEAGEEHGYQNVFQTILEDIEDQNAKK